MPKHIYARITLPDDHPLANEEAITANLVLLAEADADEFRSISGGVKTVPFGGDDCDCHLFVTEKPMEEPLLFADREKATPEDIELARKEHGSDEIEIDDDAWVSRVTAEENGSAGMWVSAWVWVYQGRCTVCGKVLADEDGYDEREEGPCADCADKTCRECGKPNNNGEGWDGLCGICADKKDNSDSH